MPVLFIDLPPGVGHDTRADLAQIATNAVTEALNVPPDKIQIFFHTTAERMRVTAHVVEPTGGTEPLCAALAASFNDVVVVQYAPDHTAKGGVLREASPTS